MYIVGIYLACSHMILNLSSERITLITTDQYIVIPFAQVEEHLTQQVIELYMTYRPTVLYVINGPGSFTNLRVWALVANLLSTLSKWTLQLMTIDKLSLFRYLYLQGILPEDWYIFFGQRKNFWTLNMKTEEQKTYTKDNFTDTEQVREDFFVDWFVGDDFPFFLDRSPQIKLHYKEERIIASYDEETLDCTDIFVPTEKIEPLYGIAPNIG